ncbi:hypothetical protein BJX63DRAFT_56787 [Aspergillus granulosus]|uniref:polynucleotide adenylyltransferase n=1 Tax=Aspergillus granulosus TaxID=176169 RepID=A0ABR4GZ56_9EURO
MFLCLRTCTRIPASYFTHFTWLMMPPPAFQFRGGNRSSHQPKNEFTFRYPRPGTSERPLLRTRREVTPELLTGLDTGAEKPAMKFARLENLSDSEEAEMDVSSDDDQEAHPRKKRASESKTVSSAASIAIAAPTPKWSNPDPYTALPPPDESQNKKVDVVKLIRKARLANATKATPTDAVVSNEDFISLAGLVDEESSRAPENAPTGPRLGNRKRTRDDEMKGSAKSIGKLGSRHPQDGTILDEWKLRHSEDSGSPWLTPQPTLSVGARLHNEIISFYHWVKPVSYEQLVRDDLVARLQTAFQNRYYGVQLRSFGSFASGLYLPTADMDLVLLSTNFMRTGVKTFGERKGQIYAFAAFLRNLNIAVPGSIETIAHARVPILKFVDKLTGLKVDLSFDNDSGLIANNTFQQWKSEYPAMPVIVAVIKQFLLLRGLNEVPTGGLGGFSITCLVTSLLQHMPYGNMAPNLGNVLMEFFYFYGFLFDYESVGIRLNPPGYFNKRVYKVYKDNNNARLCIEDPNNPDNDISGGTREVQLIFKSFAEAYRLLKARMASMVDADVAAGESILGTIIAANFDEYRESRWQLRDVFENNPKFKRYRQPSTPPPPPRSPPSQADPIPPPPPTSPKSSHPLPARPPSGAKKAQEQKDKLTKTQKKKQASKDRSARLKRLRPDIKKIPAAISNEEAMTLGGYSTQSEMDKDLLMREKELSVAS